MIMTLFPNARLLPVATRTLIDHCSLDFRNKFGALHQSFTPNKERELYSTTQVPLRVSSWSLTVYALVHLTAVTDTRRTSTIISSGTFTP